MTTDLVIQGEVALLLDLVRHANTETDDDARKAWESRFQEDLAALIAQHGEAVVAQGFARTLRNLKRDDDELAAEAAQIAGEFQRSRAALAPTIGAAEQVLEELALAHRERTKQATMKVVGVGSWPTRSVPAGIVIDDPDAAIAALSADERALFVETVDKLKTADLRAHLEKTGVLIPGTSKRDERISVSPYKFEGGRA